MAPDTGEMLKVTFPVQSGLGDDDTIAPGCAGVELIVNDLEGPAPQDVVAATFNVPSSNVIPKSTLTVVLNVDKVLRPLAVKVAPAGAVQLYSVAPTVAASK